MLIKCRQHTIDLLEARRTTEHVLPTSQLDASHREACAGTHVGGQVLCAHAFMS